MAVDANTNETYDVGVIREDLQEAFSMISPEETPFLSAIRTETASNTLFEWPVVELAALDYTNREAEGEDAPATDTPTNALRMSNYTQISDKKVSVSSTAQAVNAAAANVQRLTQQIALKMKEMKRDMEGMLLDNVAASAASSGSARTTAGLAAFIRTNTIFETGGADPTLSGATEGFPNAAATGGTTPDVFEEVDLNDLVEDIWEQGGTATVVLCNSGNKRRISQAFTGNSTRYKDAIDKQLVNTIDFYSTDFGELTVVPSRFMRTNNPGGANNSYNVFCIDPEYAAIAYLDPVQQKPLAQTGHSVKRLIWAEYGLQVDNEKAHGVIRDTTNALT